MHWREGAAKLHARREHINRRRRQMLANGWRFSRLDWPTYYHNVLDVLAQYHPEYVLQAWGASKFFFIVSLPRISLPYF